MERNDGPDSGIQKSEEREKARLETIAKNVERPATSCNGDRKALERDVQNLRQTLGTLGDRVEQLAKENEALKNDVKRLRQTVEELTSLRLIADALKAEEERAKEREGLNARIAELEEENKAQHNKIDELDYNLKQYEESYSERIEEVRELEEEKNADPHKATRGGAYAIADVTNDCKECQDAIYDEIRDLLNKPSSDKETAVQIVREYLSELFDAVFCDYRDDVPTPLSLAKRLRMSDEAAKALAPSEKKIKSAISKIKDCCERWRRENPNVELCKFYWPKGGELLKNGEAERTCQAFGLKRLQGISSPSEESRVGLTLIPGIYSKTKGSTRNLAPAYVVVASPCQTPEVKESRPLAAAPTAVNAAKIEKAPTTASAASPAEKEQGTMLEMDDLSPTPVGAEARTPKEPAASSRASQPSAVLGETNAKNDDDSNWPGFHAGWNPESDAS